MSAVPGRGQGLPEPRRGRLPWAGVGVLALVGGALALALRPVPVAAPDTAGWIALAPAPDDDASSLDLRPLNEEVAGAGGFIGARDGRLVHLGTGAPVRFWGVNGLPAHLTGEALARCARFLARRGVNLVRIHQPHFDAAGAPDPLQVQRTLEAVEALRSQGIYSHLSIYYPLWFQPAPGTPWLAGYDGRRHPFGALFFSPGFQERYRSWWRAVLLTPSGRTGRRLVDEPALAAVEILNEDSLLFPTIASLPEEQLRLLEERFAGWLAARHGSAAAALRAWGSPPLARDSPWAGRMALRPLWQVVGERTPRDQETARFLAETEASFYEDTYHFLRSLGFRGLIGTSNWVTADERVLGPLLRWAGRAGDFVDRHGYFDAAREGEAVTWSIRPGQTYRDRSALRLEGTTPGRSDFASPVMEARHAGKPAVLSEVAWERPSRFRAEAPLFVSAYAALLGTDAVAWFRVEGEGWASTLPDGTATPWPLGSPGQLGQFPAAALLFRGGLVATGGAAARVELGLGDLFQLRGSPLAIGPPLPEEERTGAATEGPVAPGQRLDPLLHLVGPVEVTFGDGPSTAIAAGGGRVSGSGRRVRSSTGELELDYGAGLLLLNAPRAQGAVGALRSAPVLVTSALRISSPLETGAAVVVSLDGAPLQTSRRMLLQVMSEEQAGGFRASPGPAGRMRLLDPGEGSWRIRPLQGVVQFTRPDAAALRVTALDLSGRPLGPAGDGTRIDLLPAVLHYLVER